MVVCEAEQSLDDSHRWKSVKNIMTSDREIYVMSSEFMIMLNYKLYNLKILHYRKNLFDKIEKTFIG